MFKRNFAHVVALGALTVLTATPVSAQDSHEWSWERPDVMRANAILGDALLPAGVFDIQYTFGQESFEGVRIETTPLTYDGVLDVYDTSPFERRNRSHMVNVAFGVTDYLTFRVAGSWDEYIRDILDQDLFLLRTESSGITDLTAEIMLRAFESDRARSHLSLGVEIPTGSIDEQDDTFDGVSLLPYSMQLGTGSFAVIPGLTLQFQNEHGTVGAQARARLRLDNNDQGYRHADAVEANLWASYRVNDMVAVSSGLRASRNGGIQGFDPRLDPSSDPAEDVLLSSETRVDIPLGVNVRFTEGLFAGNTLGLEMVWPVHQNYENVQLESERRFHVSVRRAFGM